MQAIAWRYQYKLLSDTQSAEATAMRGTLDLMTQTIARVDAHSAMI